MALMTWSDKYSVGVRPMDDQHKELVQILNDLHDAMMKGHAQTVTGPLLRKLVDYTHKHFAAEETMMVSARYPALAGHRDQHRELTRQVEEYVARFEKKEITLNLTLMNFLRDWLVNHIQKTDKEYGPWLIEHGVR
jgi:hemerythrin